MGYAGVVYTPQAETQLEVLIDSDIRYQLESEEIHWLLLRDAKGLGTLKEFEGEPVYIFVTKQKLNGPLRLAVTYRILLEPVQLVQIVDIRQFPPATTSVS
ncbi:MAG TPA: hypothetical protein VMU43_09540 [Candidatus Acidoferrum sp.]|nr:hypothetical protein [Candidatus Acidoferrum sp.]